MNRIAILLAETLFFVDVALALIIPIAEAVRWLSEICP